MNTSRIEENYTRLLARYKNIRVLMGARNLMQVDRRVSMPLGADSQRLEDMLALSAQIYDEFSSKDFCSDIDICIADIHSSPQTWQRIEKANVTELKRIQDHVISLPRQTFIDYYRLALAPGKNNLPSEEKDIDSSRVDFLRKVARLKQEYSNCESPYTALITEQLHDFDFQSLWRFHKELEPSLRKLFPDRDLLESGIRSDSKKTQGPDLSRRDMMFLGTVLLQKLGFDFNRGRMIVTHGPPASAGTYWDTRLLIRCSDPCYFMQTMDDFLYQGGAGLYMQHIPQELADKPAGSLTGQLFVAGYARFLKDQIGSLQGFWRYIESEIRTFPSLESNAHFSAQTLWQEREQYQYLSPDEPIDPMRRLYLLGRAAEIEKNLINSSLTWDQAKEQWTDIIKDVTGPEFAKNYASRLSFENFSALLSGRPCQPFKEIISYFLSCAIADAFFNEFPKAQEDIACGDFTFLFEWIKTEIFSQGHLLTTTGLLEKLSGSKIIHANALANRMQSYAARLSSVG